MLGFNETSLKSSNKVDKIQTESKSNGRSSLLEQPQIIFRHSLICYLQCDNITFPVSTVYEYRLRAALITGRICN